jgi:hypothetical protein
MNEAYSTKLGDAIRFFKILTGREDNIKIYLHTERAKFICTEQPEKNANARNL